MCLSHDVFVAFVLKHWLPRQLCIVTRCCNLEKNAGEWANSWQQCHEVLAQQTKWLSTKMHKAVCEKCSVDNGIAFMFVCVCVYVRQGSKWLHRWQLTVLCSHHHKRQPVLKSHLLKWCHRLHPSVQHRRQPAAVCDSQSTRRRQPRHSPTIHWCVVSRVLTAITSAVRIFEISNRIE